MRSAPAISPAISPAVSPAMRGAAAEPGCFHGGAFFDAIGEDFRALDRRRTIINADVLDAWFPPAPGVLGALEEALPWLLRTSPPVRCSGLVRRIAEARNLPAAGILPGAGSSDLIFRAFLHWLTPTSRVLVLDPTYGEYVHILENVIGCQVDRLVLPADSRFDLAPETLQVRLRQPYDLVVLVNPNNPTGRHLPRALLEPVLRQRPASTRVWVDETYVEYAGPDETLETLATRQSGIFVCKSMSKVYALSGARVAYLCGEPARLEPLRRITPPWVVGLPSQVAAARALEDPAYYAARWRETHDLRAQLAKGLETRGMEALPGVINSLLVRLPEASPAASEVVARSREEGLFLRDLSGMSAFGEGRHFRMAVKDRETQVRAVRILDRIMQGAK